MGSESFSALSRAYSGTLWYSRFSSADSFNTHSSAALRTAGSGLTSESRKMGLPTSCNAMSKRFQANSTFCLLALDSGRRSSRAISRLAEARAASHFGPISATPSCQTCPGGAANTGPANRQATAAQRDRFVRPFLFMSVLASSMAVLDER